MSLSTSIFNKQRTTTNYYNNCTDITACNYDPDGIYNDNLCVYAYCGSEINGNLYPPLDYQF